MGPTHENRKLAGDCLNTPALSGIPGGLSYLCPFAEIVCSAISILFQSFEVLIRQVCNFLSPSGRTLPTIMNLFYTPCDPQWAAVHHLFEIEAKNPNRFIQVIWHVICLPYKNTCHFFLNRIITE